MPTFAPRFAITNTIAAGLTTIGRARGFLKAATLSQAWIERNRDRIATAIATGSRQGWTLFYFALLS